MTTSLTLFPIALLLAAGQSVFLGLILITGRKGNRQANRYLGLFTLFVAIAMVAMAWDELIASDQALGLSALLWPRDFLYGPALYLYVREMTLPRHYPWGVRTGLHFAPAALHALAFWSLPVWNGAIQTALLTGEAETLPVFTWADRWDSIEVLGALLHVAIYLALSLRLLREHRRRIQTTFSYEEKISLDWLRYLLFGVSAVVLIWIVEDLFSDLLNLSEFFEGLLWISLIVLVYAMSFLGFRQPAIFTERTAPRPTELTAPVAVPEHAEGEPVVAPLRDDKAVPVDATKYKTSPLSNDLSRQLIDELRALMEREKPYLDSQLSLPQLADQLGVSVNYLSQIINEQLAQNFFEFINGYRIEDARHALVDPRQVDRSVLTIGIDAGFNSKSAFYAAFRKNTGMTPGAYRKSLA